MVKFPIFLAVFISAIVAGVLTSTPPEVCDRQTNTSCQACLNVSGCSFCKGATKKCFPTKINPHDAPCETADLQVQTCFANAQTLLIIIGVVSGLLVVVIIVVICCVCLKCNRCQRLRDQKRQQVNERQMEERRVAAEIRTAERNEKADQIRMKYNLMRGKDTPSVEYRRMD